MMVRKILLSFFIISTAFSALSGCMRMGPDYYRPDMDAKIPDSFQHAPTDQVMPRPEDPWWLVFNKPELNELLEEVLRNNLDIKRATARILEIRAQFVGTRADRFPQLGMQGQGQWQRQTRDVSVITPQGITQQQDRETIDLYNLALPATFELDLWGRLARAEEAARADLLQAEENRHTIAQTVVAETITLYLQMESLERRIEITKQSVQYFKRSLDLVESRYRRGLTSILDVRQARRIMFQAETLLPVLRQDLGITQQRLAILLGRYPRTRPARILPEDYYMQMYPVPPGIPSDLLLRRPDVKAAEARLNALNARVGVAKASRFPRITLTGSYGYSSGDLSRLFTPEGELWNLAFGIVQPLFDAGKLKAGQRAAEARYAQGVAEYAKTLLTAFSEVEGALLIRKEQLHRRDRFLKFLTEARETQKVAESRYQRGLVDYLTVLNSQQTRVEAELNMAQVDFAILSNRVALHRALGGGWAGLEHVRAQENIWDYFPVIY